MFALFAFGYLFGFVGLLVAVPLAAAIGVLFRFALRAISREPDLHRREHRAERDAGAAMRPATSSRSRSIMPRASRARIFSAGRPTRRRLALIETLAGLAGARGGAASGRKAPARAISRRSGRARRARASSARARAGAGRRAGRARHRRAGARGYLADGDFDERALFHLLNLAREERAYLLLTARTRAGRLDGRDPRSRLAASALPVVALAAPDDALLRAVLVKLFADRQLARRREPGQLSWRPGSSARSRRRARRWPASTARRCACSGR